MKLINQKTYALVVGVILFALGFFGFAFRSNFDISDRYLIGSLVLGFWGIVAGVGKSSSAL